MCIILVGKIGKETHALAKAQNPDGFSLFTKELGLIKNPTQKQVDKAVNQFGIWHYRIASSGSVNKDNIHPFEVCRGTGYLYHNGVLSPGMGTKSDTVLFAETLNESSWRTVESVLDATCASQRFLLVSAKDPTDYKLYGTWVVDKGIIMSHELIRTYRYSNYSKAQIAGWNIDEA